MGKVLENYSIIESIVPDSIDGKVIYLLVTAANKIKIIHKLVNILEKGGARVYIFATPNAIEILNHLDPIVKKSLGTISSCAYDTNKNIPEEDLVIIAPCTFNSISKICNGIADNYPLSIIQNAIAKKKYIIVAPAYDEYWHHPLNSTFIKTLKDWGVYVVHPDITDDKVTMMCIEKIADSAMFYFNKVKFISNKISSPSIEKLRLTNIKKYLNVFRNIGLRQEQTNTNSSIHGCYSVKLDNEWALITSTGSKLSNLKNSDLTLLKLSSDDNKIEWCGENEPSSESPLHICIYNNSKAQAVVHSHSPEITYNLKFQKYQTKNYVPYGDMDTLQDVKALLKKNRKFIILKYHGEVAIEENLEKAYSVIEKCVGI